MNRFPEAVEAANSSGIAQTHEAGALPAKRRVVCDGVKGILAFHDGRWVLENEAELTLLEALGGPSDGLPRLRAITAALNSPAAGAKDVTDLNAALRSIATTDPVFAYGVSDDLMAAAAVACAYWDNPMAIEWLCWALSVRYGKNLTEVSSVGPGWNSFLGGGSRSRLGGHRRDAGWLRWVGDDFWDRLATHESPVVREMAEAIDPNTSPERLGQLWASPHNEVLDVIASRPDFSESVLRNTATEKLDRISYANRFLHYRIAQNQALSAEDIHELAGEDYRDLTHPISYVLMNHPNASEQTLDRFAKVSCKSVVSWVAANPSTKGSTLEQILAEHPVGEDEDDGEHNSCPDCLPTWKIRAAAATNPAMPVESLGALASSPIYMVRAAVAKNLNTAVADLVELAADRRREVRAAAAANPKTPTALLEQLARDRTAVVRGSVADNEDAPRELLAQLTQDTVPYVRRCLASSHRTPDTVLDNLASDSDWLVRYWVAGHQSAPQSALSQLAGESDDGLRWQVADNPSTPAEVLVQLAEDDDMWVRECVARHPSSPAKVLKKLASDPESYVRETVARNPKSPISVLSALASDPESVVRSSVAGNPSTPSCASERLAKEDCPIILEELAGNPSTPTELLERLAQEQWARVFHLALDSLAERQQANVAT